MDIFTDDILLSLNNEEQGINYKNWFLKAKVILLEMCCLQNNNHFTGDVEKIIL